METSTLNILIPAVTTILGGFLQYKFGPSNKWNIERDRLIFERKVDLITGWKLSVGSENFVRQRFIQSMHYPLLGNLLSEEAKNLIERPLNEMSGSTEFFDTDKVILFEEISRIEKEWKLI